MDTITACILAAVVGVLLLIAGINFQAKRARLREVAGKVATELTKLGLSVIPALLTDYEQGNYPKLIYDFDHALKTLLNPKDALAEFETLRANMNAAALADPVAGPAFIKQIIAQAKTAGLPIPTA